jgi:hypothetical protein
VRESSRACASSKEPAMLSEMRWGVVWLVVVSLCLWCGPCTSRGLSSTGSSSSEDESTLGPLADCVCARLARAGLGGSTRRFLSFMGCLGGEGDELGDAGGE